MTWAELVFVVLGQVFVAGAVYGGIRADLRALHERIAQATKNADLAQRRIDELLLQRR